MTAKDYELIAAAIHRARFAARFCGDEKLGLEVVNHLVYEVGKALAADNPRFNFAMWESACQGL